MTTTQNKVSKTSKVKHAAFSAILDAAIVISNLVLILKSQMVFTAKDYAAAVPLPFIITGIPLVLLIVALFLMISQTKNTEQDDELSRLNRYKAGRISLYIFLIIVIVALLGIRNFSFAFTQDPVDNLLRLPLLLIGLVLLIENVVFIFLEKCGLE